MSILSINFYNHFYFLTDDTNTLHLKITPTLETPPVVCNHHVPVFICPKQEISNLAWDLTVQEV